MYVSKVKPLLFFFWTVLTFGGREGWAKDINNHSNPTWPHQRLLSGTWVPLSLEYFS